MHWTARGRPEEGDSPMSLQLERWSYLASSSNPNGTSSGHWTALVKVGNQWVDKDDDFQRMPVGVSVDVLRLNMELVVYVDEEEVNGLSIDEYFNPVTILSQNRSDPSSYVRSLRRTATLGAETVLDDLGIEDPNVRRRCLTTSGLLVQGTMKVVNECHRTQVSPRLLQIRTDRNVVSYK